MIQLSAWLRFALAVFACVWIGLGNVYASGLRASPIRLDFSHAKEVLSLSLGNTGTQESLVLQLSVHRWTQQNGQSVLEASRDFLATPPVLEIAAGSQRTVRVGARHYPATACETSYRLFVTEIPPQNTHGAPLRFRTQMRLPIFVRTADTCKPDIHWTWNQTGLRVENHGDAHIQLSDIRLQIGEKRWPLKLQEVGYVLPGAWVDYPLPEDFSGTEFTLIYRSSAGEKTQILRRDD